MLHPARLPADQLLNECRVSHTRRSGPGGQHRNKVQTAVVLEHSPTGIHAEASERRSQQQNKQIALQRLRVNLALAVREQPIDKPSDLWQQRVKSTRISVSAQHEDFPALLAEVLDQLHSQEFEIAPTAAWLGISSSQLVKFLKVEPTALAEVNRHRKQLGISQLR